MKMAWSAFCAFPGWMRRHCAILLGTPEMSVAILDFLLGHEDLLLRFCESASVSSKQLHLARHRLNRDEMGGEA